jgi:cyclic pyranopterin monophosphate synthase
MDKLTHFDTHGRAHMVDIGEKLATERIATAEGRLIVAPATLNLALSRRANKGDAIAVAELAGIMAAKRTADLIPLCHPLPLQNVNVSIVPSADESHLIVTAVVKTRGQTGVEMEALTAVSVACLTLYDMLKAIDKNMTISGITLMSKTGGQSGDYRRAPE